MNEGQVSQRGSSGVSQKGSSANRGGSVSEAAAGNRDELETAAWNIGRGLYNLFWGATPKKSKKSIGLKQLQKSMIEEFKKTMSFKTHSPIDEIASITRNHLERLPDILKTPEELSVIQIRFYRVLKELFQRNPKALDDVIKKLPELAQYHPPSFSESPDVVKKNVEKLKLLLPQIRNVFNARLGSYSNKDLESFGITRAPNRDALRHPVEFSVSMDDPMAQAKFQLKIEIARSALSCPYVALRLAKRFLSGDRVVVQNKVIAELLVLQAVLSVNEKESFEVKMALDALETFEIKLKIGVKSTETAAPAASQLGKDMWKKVRDENSETAENKSTMKMEL